MTARNPLVIAENLDRALKPGRQTASLSDHFGIVADLALPALGLGSWLLVARETPSDRIAV